MKLTNILLGCLIVLLGVMVYNQFKDKPNTVVVTPDHVTPDSVVPNPATPTIEETENVVSCMACVGGNNGWEDNGKCSVCGGSGRGEKSELEKKYKKWLAEVVPCKWCGGTGESYEARVTPITERDLMAPPGYYNCKVCKGKKSGTRGELIKNFKAAQQVYGSAL
ncbi:MAG: hypothetical protein K2N05_05405 [Muribaculaceae bacterium]|nr:hypothetical protein [Muribaculaceae bacterium]